jgi:hypothetical protein
LRQSPNRAGDSLEPRILRHGDNRTVGNGASISVPLLATFLLLLVGVITWIEVVYTGKRGDLLIQAASVFFLGGLLTIAVRLLEDRRRRRSQADEYRWEVLRRLITAYNDLKAVRRNMRGLGFCRSCGSLEQWQANEFHAQMHDLVRAELALEEITLLLGARKEIFASLKYDPLGCTTRALRRVIDDWEEHGYRVAPGLPIRTWHYRNLRRFVHDPAEDWFKPRVQCPVEELLGAIRDEVLAPLGDRKVRGAIRS